MFFFTCGGKLLLSLLRVVFNLTKIDFGNGLSNGIIWDLKRMDMLIRVWLEQFDLLKLYV